MKSTYGQKCLHNYTGRLRFELGRIKCSITVNVLFGTFCTKILFVAEPETSRVVAYWEGGNLISTAVDTDFDVYILEVSLCGSSILRCT